MLKLIGCIRAVVLRQTVSYFGFLISVEMVVMLISAISGDVFFGQIWVVGALSGGFLIFVACLYALGKLNKTEVVVENNANCHEMSPFSFTLGGPGLPVLLSEQAITSTVLVRKDRFKNAA